MQELTYEYTKGKMDAFRELYNYIQDNVSMIPLSSSANCPILIKRMVYGEGDYEYTYYYNNKVFMYEFNMPQYMSSEEECFSHYYNENHYTLGCVQEKPEYFKMVNLSCSNEKDDEQIDLLSTDELTEEMYEQLLFVYDEHTVFSTFMISHILGMGVDYTLKVEPEFDAQQALIDMKEYFDDSAT